MPRLSKQKTDKIKEQILYFLYSIFPKQVFTSDIAKEMARDEEFVKKIMIELEKSELAVKIDKNSDGIKYEKRIRWRISNKAHEIYVSHQQNKPQISESLEKNIENQQ